MKKFYLIFIVIFSALHAHSQSGNDSVLISLFYESNFGHGPAILNERIENYFDSTGKVVSTINFFYSDSRIIQRQKLLNTYDGAGYIIERFIQEYNSNNWINYSRELTYFNSLHQVDSIINQKWINNNWERQMQYSYFYDQNDSLILLEWSTTINNYGIVNYYRDSMGRDTLYLLQYLNSSTLTYDNYDRVRKYYDAAGHLSNSKSEHWQNTYWQLQDTIEYSYYPNDSLFIMKRFEPDSGGWKIWRIDSIVYSGDTLINYIGYANANDSVIIDQGTIDFDDGSGYNNFQGSVKLYSGIWNIFINSRTLYDSLQNILKEMILLSGDSINTYTYFDHDGHLRFKVSEGTDVFDPTYDSTIYYYYKTFDEQDLCIGGNDSLWVDSGMISNIWNNGDSGQYTIVSDTGSYYCNLVNQYGHAFQTEPLIIDWALSPYLPKVPDSSVTSCASNSGLTLFAPNIPSYKYQWYRNDTAIESESYWFPYRYNFGWNIPKIDGAYYVVVSNDCGIDTSLTTHVSFWNSVISVKPYGPVTICPGDTIALIADSGFVKYDWDGSDDTTNSTIATYQNMPRLTVTDIHGCFIPAADTIISPLYSTIPIRFFQQDSLIQALISYDIIDIQWYFNGSQMLNDTTRQIIINQSGNYKIVVSFKGCTDSADKYFYFPAYNIKNDEYALYDKHCIGDTIVLGDLYELTGGFSPLHFNWTPSNGLNSDTVPSPYLIAGTDSVYILTVTDSAGRVLRDTFHLKINTPVSSTIHASIVDDCWYEYYTLYSNYLGEGEYHWYFWGQDAGTEIDDSSTITYLCGKWYLIFDNGCLSYSDTIQTFYLPHHPVTLHPEITPADLCSVDSVRLIATVDNPDIMQFRWKHSVFGSIDQVSLPFTNDTITIHKGGDYYVTVTDTNGCETWVDYSFDYLYSREKSVNIVPSGIITACKGDTVKLATSIGVNFFYQWYNYNDYPVILGTDSIFDATFSGKFIVRAYNGFGCYGYDTVLVSFDDEPTTLTLTYDSFKIYALSNHYTNNVQWYRNDSILTGQTNFDIHPDYPGEYKIILQSECGVVMDSIMINCAAVVSTISPSCNNECNGSAYIIHNGTSPFTQTWSTNDFVDSVSNLCDGNYSVRMTDGNGCVAIDSFSIQSPFPLLVSYGVTKSACDTCPNGNVAISVQGGTPPYSILWNTGDPSAFLSGLIPGNYVVCITDYNQCVECDTINVEGVIGIESIEKAESVLHVFPNPVNTFVNIEIKSEQPEENYNLKLLDIHGRIVKENSFRGNTTTLDCNELTSGIYFLLISDDEKESLRKKLVVIR